MSDNYEVEVKATSDPSGLPSALRISADEIAGLLLRMSGLARRKSLDFAFRVVPEFTGSRLNPTHNWVQTFSLRTGNQTPVAVELELVEALRSAHARCGTRVDFMKVIATAFESYYFRTKNEGRANPITRSAQVLVRGYLAEYEGCSRADGALDELDDANRFYCAELSLAVRGFEGKGRQFRFYQVVFASVRECVGSKAELRFELVAAQGGRTSWSEVFGEYRDGFAKEGVLVEGITLIDGEKTRLI